MNCRIAQGVNEKCDGSLIFFFGDAISTVALVADDQWFEP